MLKRFLFFILQETIGSFYDSCSFDSGCDSTKSLICVQSGETTLVCDCPSTSYWSGTTSSCQSKLLNAQACSNTTQCRTDLGLYCDVGSTNQCICPSSQFWDGNSCGILFQSTRISFVRWIHNMIIFYRTQNRFLVIMPIFNMRWYGRIDLQPE